MSTATTNAPVKQNGQPAAQTRAVAQIKPDDWEKPTTRSGLEVFVPGVVEQLGRALPRFLAGQANRLIRCMITETSKNPALLDCTPLSLFGAVIQAGQLGLSIGGALGEAYIIPFGDSKLTKKHGREIKVATLIIGYKGLIQLGHRSGGIKRITPVVVRQGDLFNFERGMDQTLTHKPLRNNHNRVTDYYVVVELMNGGKDFETFSVEDAIEFRDRYSSTRGAPQWLKEKSPWYDITPERTGPGFDAMALKTLIRRFGKRLPLSVEWSTAVALDEAGETGTDQSLGALIDMPSNEQEPVERTDALRNRMDNAKVNGHEHPPLAEGEITPTQSYAMELEQAETEAQLDAVYLAAFQDQAVSKSDKTRIGTLRDERRTAMRDAQA